MQLAAQRDVGERSQRDDGHLIPEAHLRSRWRVIVTTGWVQREAPGLHSARESSPLCARRGGAAGRYGQWRSQRVLRMLRRLRGWCGQGVQSVSADGRGVQSVRADGS